MLQLDPMVCITIQQTWKSSTRGQLDAYPLSLKSFSPCGRHNAFAEQLLAAGSPEEFALQESKRKHIVLFILFYKVHKYSCLRKSVWPNWQNSLLEGKMFCRQNWAQKQLSTFEAYNKCRILLSFFRYNNLFSQHEKNADPREKLLGCTRY